MECTFYRPQQRNYDEYENIVGKLFLDLIRLCTSPADKKQVCCYAFQLSQLAEPLESHSEMYFWGLDQPEAMPDDVRVDYFYSPTYLATAFLMRAILLFPELAEEEEIAWDSTGEHVNLLRTVMPSALLGCTVREFMGHGKDAFSGLLDAMEVFAFAGADEFVKRYPEMCPKFTKLYKNKVRFLREKSTEGQFTIAWGADYRDDIVRILHIIDDPSDTPYQSKSKL